MEIGPIFRALLRNRTGAILIAVQIAFTLTVVLNAAVMINEQVSKAGRPSGLNEADTFHMQSEAIDTINPQVTINNDLRAIRETPGVANALQMNTIPLSNGGWSTGVRVQQGDDPPVYSAAMYMVDDQAIDTMQLKLIAGENFAASDVVWRKPDESGWPGRVIITKALAKSLFPDDSPETTVGRAILLGESPANIIGIVDQLQAPWTQSSQIESSVMVPQQFQTGSPRYLIRAEPGQRDRLMPEIEAQLAERERGRMIRNLYSMDEVRRRSYNLETGLAMILGFVMVVLLLITGLGILGLASLSVRRRIKQIGIRRALGASTRDVLRYFLIENLLITSSGVVLGAIMAVAFNIALVNAMNFPKIEWYGVPLGMVVLVLLGQLAVWGPARQACGVSPATATRTV
ncbi:MAG: ABC transporter permease [Proteobacteria bacterium]|jgi:putative ABC transport system permease protein|nr:ABC transporter permease [Pseudomonadota bacterium]